MCFLHYNLLMKLHKFDLKHGHGGWDGHRGGETSGTKCSKPEDSEPEFEY